MSGSLSIDFPIAVFGDASTGVWGLVVGGPDPQLQVGAKGYDHNYVMNKPLGKLGVIATAFDPESGRVMEVSSTAPGLQFYTGNGLDGTLTGKGGIVYARRSGFAMEAEAFPDLRSR